MSRSFFAPDSKTPAAPSDSVRAPFLSNGNGTSTPIENEIRSMKEGGRPGSPIPPPKAALSTLAPILSYCGSSIMMTVLNKYVLKTHFSLNLIVLLIQSLVGGFLVAGASYLKLIEIKPLDIKLLQSWVPVSTSLVFVIWTGSKALVSRSLFVIRGIHD
jgi:GDP-mannose transporter